MQEREVMQHILASKVATVPLSAPQIKTAQGRFTQLVLTNYRKKLEEVQFHKYKFVFGFTNLALKLDSRDCRRKASKLRELDPSTAQTYPDATGEVVEYLEAELSADKIVVTGLDLPKPMILVDQISVSGSIVFAEVMNQDFVEVGSIVCGVETKTRGSVGDVKLYSDLAIIAENFEIYYAGNYSKILDDFYDESRVHHGNMAGEKRAAARVGPVGSRPVVPGEDKGLDLGNGGLAGGVNQANRSDSHESSFPKGVAS
jgi:hypothetical protein